MDHAGQLTYLQDQTLHHCYWERWKLQNPQLEFPSEDSDDTDDAPPDPDMRARID